MSARPPGARPAIAARLRAAAIRGRRGVFPLRPADESP